MYELTSHWQTYYAPSVAMVPDSTTNFSMMFEFGFYEPTHLELRGISFLNFADRVNMSSLPQCCTNPSYPGMVSRINWTLDPAVTKHVCQQYALTCL